LPISLNSFQQGLTACRCASRFWLGKSNERSTVASEKPDRQSPVMCGQPVVERREIIASKGYGQDTEILATRVVSRERHIENVPSRVGYLFGPQHANCRRSGMACRPDIRAVSNRLKADRIGAAAGKQISFPAKDSNRENRWHPLGGLPQKAMNRLLSRAKWDIPVVTEKGHDSKRYLLIHVEDFYGLLLGNSRESVDSFSRIRDSGLKTEITVRGEKKQWCDD